MDTQASLVGATQSPLGGGGSGQIPDRVIMYASVFMYNPKERMRIMNYTPDVDKIGQFEVSQTIKQGSKMAIEEFTRLSESQEREYFQQRGNVEKLMYTLV